MTEKKDLTRPGRPPGAKNKHSPDAFRKAYSDKTRHQLHRLLDAGDKDTVLAVTKLLWKNLPAPAVTLRKVKSSDDAIKAMAQLINMTAQGEIDGDQADRLERQISKYLEITELAEIKRRLEVIEAGNTDGQI
ncbi:hypothetical protein ACFL0S_03915 [Thermodesulfobacteriota bacterium]